MLYTDCQGGRINAIVRHVNLIVYAQLVPRLNYVATLPKCKAKQ